MTSLLSIGNGFRALAMGVFLLLIAQGCSKHEDDCPAPQASTTDVSAKAFSEGGAAPVEVKQDAAPKSGRSPEITGDDTDGDGISDDGDDEADGEGNKKSRPAH